MSNRKSCQGCTFYRPISAGHEMACHYMLMTGEKRGCPPENCTKKEPYRRQPKQAQNNNVQPYYKA